METELIRELTLHVNTRVNFVKMRKLLFVVFNRLFDNLRFILHFLIKVAGYSKCTSVSSQYFNTHSVTLYFYDDFKFCNYNELF